MALNENLICLYLFWNYTAHTFETVHNKGDSVLRMVPL